MTTTKHTPMSDRRDDKTQRVLPLLVMVSLLHLTYPLTAYGALPTVNYQVLYSLMMLSGIFLGRHSRYTLQAAVVTAVLFILCGTAYAFDAHNAWKILATYLALMAFQAIIIGVLLHFIFNAQRVTRDVLYAAVTVYLLMAAIFVPVYGIIIHFEPGAFTDGGAPTGKPAGWQQLVYFSFVTLTTLGFGDVTPISWWARAVAGMQAAVGVLYLAVLIARLVGLYTAGPAPAAHLETNGGNRGRMGRRHDGGY